MFLYRSSSKEVEMKKTILTVIVFALFLVGCGNNQSVFLEKVIIGKGNTPQISMVQAKMAYIPLGLKMQQMTPNLRI